MLTQDFRSFPQPQQARACYELLADCMLELLFDLEEGDTTLIRNVGKLLLDYTVSYRAVLYTLLYDVFRFVPVCGDCTNTSSVNHYHLIQAQVL